jgi:hypothetical protein
MKSAYERAMERFGGDEPETPLSEAQKEELAAIDKRYQAKLAERELFLQQKLKQARTEGDHQDAADIEKQLLSERERINDEREASKEKVRQQPTD